MWVDVVLRILVKFVCGNDLAMIRNADQVDSKAGNGSP